MAQELTNKKLFSTDQVIRLATTVFLIGAAWTRLEYKMDAAQAETNSVFRQYVIQNEADKEMIRYKMESLVKQVDVNSLTLKTIADYIKPDDVMIKDEKRR